MKIYTIALLATITSVSAHATTPLTMGGIPIKMPGDSEPQAQNKEIPKIPVSINDHITGHPSLGYWMITKDNQVAHWLGDRKIDGKQDSRYTLEPINVEFLVKADSASNAATILDNTLRSDQVGFSHLSVVHSGAYKANIGGKTYNQYHDNTYSDKASYQQNNHLRLFGPTVTPYSGYYVFTGSCSEETGWFTQKERKKYGANLIGHHFVSFNYCRDLLYNRFEAISSLVQYINIHNSYTNNNFTTRDHKGNVAQITM